MTAIQRYVACLIYLAALTGQARAGQDGDGTVTVSGELKTWHKVTLTIDGPWAKETDTEPNPFTDYRLAVTFSRGDFDGRRYVVPGYFAADGKAGETSAKEGSRWRVHFAPDQPGEWRYSIGFAKGSNVALMTDAEVARHIRKMDWFEQANGKTGSFAIKPSDKTGRDLRGKGRLQYVGERYLKFAQSGEYFLKAGADAPETLLAFKDFDGTRAHNPKKSPLKSYKPHIKDWNEGDPTWQDGEGKGLIGAINYLSSTGCNAFSFLTYNAGGDGDNVWPFTERDKKFHYDVSKLDQWQKVFDHATTKGMYLHFKLQETENDDTRTGGNNNADVPTALDGGDLGPERKVYLREMVARFGHNLALNWNLGEENTQSTKQQRDMAAYLAAIDPYKHHIVIHTYPNQQDRVYGALMGDQSSVSGASLQNSNVRDCHWQTVKWVTRSKEQGKPWVVAFDEPGEASFGTPPDPDWPGMERHKKLPATIHDVRKYALWGTLMAGGTGVEYYFGYKLPENDLNAEDWRSRAQTWKYSAVALKFFHEHEVPFWEMESRNDLLSANAEKNEGYCLAKPGELYLVYLPAAGQRKVLDLREQDGTYTVQWFNPRTGGGLVESHEITGGTNTVLPKAPRSGPDDDWLAVIRRK
ncbi:MAG: DUF5060 domain-containing protein [Planctomycetota bacterium]